MWFLLDLKNIFQFFSLHKQGYFCFRIVSKGRIFQNIFLENANSNGSRRAWVACDNSTLKIRKICFSPNNGAFSVTKLHRGTQREILRKRPKNTNKAWIKFSETILSILRDCWKKLSVPHSQQDWWKSSQPATLQPAIWLTGKYHRAQFRSWVVSNPYK